MSSGDLGRLERITDLRRTWPDEARDFTPWLAQTENLSLLSEHLGFGADGLELEAVEKFVGPYRADILCRNTNDGSWVLIENQLTRSDHSHLGQIVCYAAGLEATHVVWIATSVTAEHRAAMEWLNEISSEAHSFYAIEIELWRIGESAKAPRFNNVVHPNPGVRQAREARKGLTDTALTPTRQMQYEYWAGLESKISEKGGPLRPVTPQPQSWTQRGVGRTGANLVAYRKFTEGWVRAEIYLTGPNAKLDFDELESHRTEIDAAYHAATGGTLDWQRLDGKDSRICDRLDNTDPSDPLDHDRQHGWLITRMEHLDSIFRPRLARLSRGTKPGIDTA